MKLRWCVVGLGPELRSKLDGRVGVEVFLWSGGLPVRRGKGDGVRLCWLWGGWIWRLNMLRMDLDQENEG